MDRARSYFPTGLTTWFPILIVVAGFLAYANSFGCPFLFDDTTVITRNPHIYHLWPPWKAIQSPNRLLADYSFALNHAWAGFSPAEYRLVNIMIHLGAGLLLYGIVRRTLLVPRWESRLASSAPGLAFATALLWVLHPLQTESVTYIAQRIESLMGFLFLLTFYLFIRGMTASRGRGVWLTVAVTACALGMATKEVMVVSPILLLLYDRIFFRSSPPPPAGRWKWHAAFFSTWGVLALLLWLAAAKAQAEHVPLVGAGASRGDYALTQLNIIALYLRLAVFPHPLCLDYQYPLVASPAEALWPGLLTVVLGLASLWGIFRRSWLGFLGAWFFLILAPSSSFNPLPDAVFEHRMYLPLAAVILLAVVMAQAALGRWAANRTTRGILEGLLLTLAAGGLLAGTVIRNMAYRSEEAMWRDVISKRPGNYRVYVSLSTALIDQNRFQEAASVCSNLLARLPPFVTLTPDLIATLHAPTGQPPLPMYYAMALNNLGLATGGLNRPDEAKAHFREAIRVFPAGYWAHRNLGEILRREGKLTEAIAEWRQATGWQPKDYQSHCFLGLALSQAGQYREAVDHLETAVRLNTEFWFARAQWAWLLATCPSNEVRNGRLALQVAEPLLEIGQGSSPRSLDIMAACYAETGDFVNAIRLEQEAVALARQRPPEAGQDYRVPDLERRLALYQTGRPCRELDITQ